MRLSSPGITLTYDEANDGTYEHRDRFGRILAQPWKKGVGYLDRHDYTYDLAGNRLTRSVDDNVSALNALDQTFTYDNSHRLDQFSKGGTLERDWALDAWGNWDTLAVGQTTQTRTHNEANETSTISTWQDPVHDAAGNMTKMPIPADMANSSYDVKYDAWNRPVEFKDGTTLVATYEYDGLNRRIKKTVGSTDYDYYYSQQWQVLETETTVSSTTTLHEQQVWHPHYVDALAVRASPYTPVPSVVPTMYALQDANFNVTAFVDSVGVVGERYDYTPYGEVVVLKADFSADADGISDVLNPYTYTGRRFDTETGIYYYRNRYYHAQLGRFCSKDPIGYDAGWNLYEYVGGRPTMYTDPNGEVVPLLAVGLLVALWNKACSEYAIAEAEKAFSNDKEKHCMVACLQTKCTGYVQGSVTFLGLFFWEIIGGWVSGDSWEDVKAGVQGMQNAYTAPLVGSCEDSCKGCKP